jgi:hypothetical protein
MLLNSVETVKACVNSGRIKLEDARNQTSFASINFVFCEGGAKTFFINVSAT